MKFLRIFAPFLVTSLLLSSCFQKPLTPVEKLSQQEPELRSQGKYNSYLSLEYLRYSRQLLAAGDKKSAQYFSKKGREAALGLNVVPENPLVWKADQAQMTAMVLMQKRLEDILLSSRMRIDLPIQTAHLTYLYDCWISRESKQIFRADELAKCRIRFTKLLDEIENYIDESKKDKTKKITIIEPKFERFEIAFDLNISKLNAKGRRDLVKFLKYVGDLKQPYKILLVGNADRSGSKIYNKSLAIKRANRVKYFLMKNGVHGEFIEMRSVGEDFPDLLTKDNLTNQLNRNVAIYLLKGSGDFKDYPLPLLENIIYKKEVKKARKDRGL